MYNTYSAKEFKKVYGHSEDYHVDGLLMYGGAYRAKKIKDFKKALEELNITATFREDYDSNFETVIQFSIGDKNFWFEVVYGSSYTSEVSHLASIYGSKANILLGSCGGLSLDSDHGDTVIPVFSYGNESTTRMYEPEAYDFRHYSSKDLNNYIKSKLNDTSKVLTGSLMTCQAILIESEEDVQRWSKEGYVGIDMESATVFAVSNRFKVPASALLYVADNLIKGTTLLSEEFNILKQKREEIVMSNYKIAIQTLLEYSDK